MRLVKADVGLAGPETELEDARIALEILRFGRVVEVDAGIDIPPSATTPPPGPVLPDVNEVWQLVTMQRVMYASAPDNPTPPPDTYSPARAPAIVQSASVPAELETVAPAAQARKRRIP